MRARAGKRVSFRDDVCVCESVITIIISGDDSILFVGVPLCSLKLQETQTPLRSRDFLLLLLLDDVCDKLAKN